MGQQRRFWFDKLKEKRQVLRRGKDVERLENKKEAQDEGGRQFQREGSIIEKDLIMQKPLTSSILPSPFQTIEINLPAASRAALTNGILE